MASAKSVYAELGTFQKIINACLTRCDAAPFPSVERENRIKAIRDELTNISQRAGAVYADITKDAQAGSLTKAAELAAAKAAVTAAQEEQRTIQVNFQNENSELAKRRAAASGEQERTDIQAQTQKLNNEYNARNTELEADISRKQALVNRLQHEYNQLNNKFNREAEEIRAKECPEALVKVVDEAKALVDKVGLVEQEISARAGAALVREVKAEFETNAESFKSAEAFHRSQARRLFWAMLGVGASICAMIYVLFVATKPSTPVTDPSVPPTMAIIEHLVLVATGRVALLVVAGFALKYLGNLHAVHAEQSVIYRDRLAALGIAESLLKATPELEQRREMLKSLTNVYLDVDESAFGRHRKRPDNADDLANIDNHVKRLNKMTEAVASLLEPVAKVLDRVRDKTK